MNKPAFLLAVPLALLLSACASPQPTGTIAFSSDRDGDAEIYLINADATTSPTRSPQPGFDMRSSFCYSCLQYLYKACRAWGHSSAGRAHQSH